ncbi:MAG TPA: M20/M25/M40 family metallo-hydrolase [Acidimicrobiales bacterium]|jgi:putative selenium metabolism hydrolase|nr:M20/M25/M40 family metallo-hydrolase [Acidimicrobiales bacterium]
MSTRYPVNDAALVELATDLARTASVSGTEGAAVSLVTEAMTRAGFESVEIDASGNAVGALGPHDGATIMIDGHIDSIPLHSADRWTVDPFGGEVRDGNLYGLGICDQKASIAAAVWGVAAAVAKLSARVVVVASVCEEEMEGGALTEPIAALRPDAFVTSEPNDTRLCIGQRGRAKVEVLVIGRACHAGHADIGLNAAHAMAALITEVGRIDHPAHPRLGRRDLNCIDVHSEPYPSVSTIPGSVTARFDCRFLPGETPESVIALLVDAAGRAWAEWPEQPGLEVALVEAAFETWTGRGFALPEYAAAWWTPEDSALVRAATSALSSVGLDPTPTHYSFCTNGSYAAGLCGIPTIGFGVGVESMAHQVDEHVSLSSLRAGAQGYAALATMAL